MEGSSEYHSKLIHTIIEEYGTEDLDLLQQKMKQMRILDYVELPNSAVELLVQSEENSAIDSIQEIDIANEDNDPDIGVLLKVVFSPDYNVSVAEVLILGSELSQHISTAGMKASGTSNKKFAMNGCVLVGTLDGANVEIKQEVGEENIFPSGTRADEIDDLRKERAEGKFVPDFREVKAFVRSGVFGQYSYDELMGSSEGNEGYGRTDYFLVAKDFPASQEEVGEAY
uniref:Alpha-1,4 glucan phosphorylase n=1 Tax=Rhizophora mucronata TaxID=61149 RepID=A0A2P2L1B3_RHIMU